MAEARRVCSRFEQDPDHVFESGSRRLVQRRVASGLRHVYVCALFDQEPHRFAIAAQCNAGMQWLIVHGVPREAVHMCSVSKQESGCLGSAKCGCQVKRRPTVGRAFMDQHGILSQQRFDAAAIPQRRGLEDIQTG